MGKIPRDVNITYDSSTDNIIEDQIGIGPIWRVVTRCNSRFFGMRE